MSFKFKPIYAVGVVIVVLVVLALIYMATSSKPAQVVASGDTIEVNYTGAFTNGTVFDSTALHGGQPLQFTVGAGQVIQGFDQAVVGMKVGQEKQVIIPENEAYGPVNPSLIVEIPANSVGNQTVEPGMTVSKEIGNQTVQGTVTAVNATTITLDFNPPLAGQTLVFNITVVKILNES